jgi:hypothetical protein
MRTRSTWISRRCNPWAPLCGNLYARQRDRFELKRVSYAQWRKARGKV